MKNQKGFSPLSIIILVVVAVAAVTLLLSSQGKLGTQTLTQNTAPSINNSSDLTAASADLDNTDMSQFDSDLNQLKVDASSF